MVGGTGEREWFGFEEVLTVDGVEEWQSKLFLASSNVGAMMEVKSEKGSSC